MVQRRGGFRHKTRNKLSKNARTQGKVSIRRSLQEFETGEPVMLAAEPAVQHGMYHPRFHGRAGTVAGKQGACYVVKITDGGKTKDLIVHPVHLRKN